MIKLILAYISSKNVALQLFHDDGNKYQVVKTDLRQLCVHCLSAKQMFH